MIKLLRYTLLCLCCFAFAPLGAQGQRSAYHDSLYAALQRQPADTGTVLACFLYGASLMPGNPDSAGIYHLKGLAMARKLGYLRGVGIFTSYYIDVLNARGEYARALAVVKPAATIFRYLHDESNLLRAYNNIGNQYQNTGHFAEAAHWYLQALALAEKTKDLRLQGKISNNLASVLASMEDYPKAYRYAQRALALARQRRDTMAMASSTVNLGFVATKLNRYHEGQALFQEVIALGRQLGDSTYVMDGLINTGSIYSDMNRHARALQIYRYLVQITERYPDREYRLYAQLGYAQELLKTGQPLPAARAIDTVIALGRQMQANDELRQAYYTAAEIKEALRQPVAALQYRKMYEALNDSLVGASTRKNVQQLEIAYQTAEKDKALAEHRLLLTQKDLELQQKKKWQALFLAGMILLAVLCFVIWLRFQHRKKLHMQKLQTLEKERAVQLLEAAMQGEEKERARVSKDLHDGVGGLLSAVKMHFSALKGELSLQQHPSFNHAIQLLDDAITDVRKTAHNLMPETLYRYGLQKALEVFCNNISHAGTLEVTFYSVGNVQRFKPNFELSVYRIVQELVNNIIKHSKANEALVQLSQQEERLSITVEDNGIGFTQQSQQNGMGLRSLQSRIRALNGNIEIEAATGHGTTAYIEFDVSMMKHETVTV